MSGKLKGPNPFCANDRFAFLILERKGKPFLCFIDKEDYPLVKDYRWHVHSDLRSRTFYALSNFILKDGILVRTTVRMHNLLMPGVKKVDHKNCNGLDNTRANLRPITNQQNGQNRKKRFRTKSKFKGVKLTGKSSFLARITADGKQIHLGTFGTEIDAAKAYDAAAKKYFGAYGYLNFPAEKGAQ